MKKVMKAQKGGAVAKSPRPKALLRTEKMVDGAQQYVRGKDFAEKADTIKRKEASYNANTSSPKREAALGAAYGAELSKAMGDGKKRPAFAKINEGAAVRRNAITREFADKKRR